MPREPDVGRDDSAGAPGDRDRFAHMLAAARDAVSFVDGRIREELDTDAMLRRALINAIGEVGEAAAKSSVGARETLPDIPWRLVIRMRNILVHVYWGVELDYVWKTAIEDLPPLIAALERALGEWPPE